MTSSHTGRCFCGAVTFRFAQPPLAHRACWCRDCQYLACGNASINAFFRTEAMEVSGEVSVHVSQATSGNVMRRSFCPRCGTQLFSAAETRPGLIAVRVGTLDDREGARPGSVIWTGSAPSWGWMEPGLPGCEGQPATPPVP